MCTEKGFYSWWVHGTTDDTHLFLQNWFSVRTFFPCHGLICNVNFMWFLQCCPSYTGFCCFVLLCLFWVCLCLVWNQLFWNSTVLIRKHCRLAINFIWLLRFDLKSCKHPTMFIIIIIKIRTENHVVLFFNSILTGGNWLFGFYHWEFQSKRFLHFIGEIPGHRWSSRIWELGGWCPHID